MQLGLMIRGFFDNLTMPKDGLANQAREIVKANDVDGNGYIDMENPEEGTSLGPFGMTLDARTGFSYADSNGNKDGHASVKEIRAALQRYDTGVPWEPNSARNGILDGLEWLPVLRDFVRGGTPRTPASEQAQSGADQLDAPPTS